MVTTTSTEGRKMRNAVTRSSPQRHRDTEELKEEIGNKRVELFFSVSEPALSAVEGWLCGEQGAGAKCCMQNPSGRCVSNSRNDPTLSSPTMPAILARVSSSFSGSGAGGRKSPFCAERGR